MGFLNKVFGEKKPERVSVSLENARPFLEKEIASKKQQLLKDSANKLAEIKHLLREANSSLEGLGQAGPAEDTPSKKSNRLNKIVGTAKNNALRQVSSLLEKLGPPNTEDFFEIRKYCLESIQALSHSGQFGKNVAYAGISFKNEMKRIGNDFKQLNKAFASLKALLNQNKAVFLAASLKEKLSQLRALKAGVEAAEKETEELGRRLEGKSPERQRISSSLEKLRQSDSFKQIDGLNEKKAALLKEKQAAKTELLDLFAKIERPLHRLDKAAQARKIFLPGELAPFLHKILVNPFTALKADPKAETLKLVLAETKQAIESGLIELKEREKEKKLAVLQELLSFDFFGKAFWRFNKIDADILAIEKQLRELPGIGEEASLLASLKKSDLSREDLKAELDSKKKRLLQDTTSLKSLEAEIQKLLSEATGKEVMFSS
jgi:hypothetical protein